MNSKPEAIAALRSHLLAFGPVWSQTYTKVTVAFGSNPPIHDHPEVNQKPVLAVETFPNKDHSIGPVVQDVALLWRQHGLLEGARRRHTGDLHCARRIRDL